MAKQEKKIRGTEEVWDERLLGAEDAFVAVATDEEVGGVDEAAGLKPISIRLQTELIEDFKLIAQINGVGYQTLMRQVLIRFADCEKKRLLQEAAADAARAAAAEPNCDPAVPERKRAA